MDLVRSWVAAIVFYVLGSVLTVQVATAARVSQQELASMGGTIVWNLFPSLLIFFVMVALSALLHPAPQREEPRRHLIAVLGVPAVVTVFNLVVGFATGSAVIGVIAGIVGSALGVFPAWVLMRKYNQRRAGTAANKTAARSGYF
jgi:hypothetical protein